MKLFHLFSCLCLFGTVLSIPMMWELTGGNPHGIGQGWDIVTERQTLPIVNWNYNTQQTLSVNGVQYLMPDELYGYSAFGGENDTRVMIIQTYNDYYQSYMSNWDISAGATIDGVSLTASFSRTKLQVTDMINSSLSAFGKNDFLYYAFNVQLWPGFTVNSHFQSAVDALPATYDPDAYQTFIDYFGTHVLTKVQYGSMFNFTTVFETSLFKKYSMQYISQQIGLSIGYEMFKFGIQQSGYSNKTKVDEIFKQASNTDYQVLGGNKGIFDTQGFKAWWQSCQFDWDVLYAKSQAFPIYTLISDTTKAANLKKAIITYGNTPCQTC